MKFEIEVIYRFLRNKQRFIIEVDDHLSMEEIENKILETVGHLGAYEGSRENFILTAGARSIHSISVEDLKEFALNERVVLTQTADPSSFTPTKREETSNIYLNSSQIGIISLGVKYKISREDIDALNDGYPLRIDRTLLIPQDGGIKVVSSCNSTYLDIFLEKAELIEKLYDLFP